MGVPVLKRLLAGKQTEDVRQDCVLGGCSGVVLICGGAAENNSSAPDAGKIHRCLHC